MDFKHPFLSFNFSACLGFELTSLLPQHLDDPFFYSFSLDYPLFHSWFLKKSSQLDNAFFFFSQDSSISGFIKLKVENTNLFFSPTPVIKISSFKLTQHSTAFSNQFLFLLHFYADQFGFDYIYATCFPKHSSLINKFKKFGYFVSSTLPNGELLLIKKLNQNLILHPSFSR